MVVGKNAAMRKGLFSRSQCRDSDDAAIIFTSNLSAGGDTIQNYTSSRCNGMLSNII